jgi:hypothetical protein
MIGWIQRTAASRSEAVVFTKCGRDSGAIPLLQVPGRTIAQQHIYGLSSFGMRHEFSNSNHEFTLQHRMKMKKKRPLRIPFRFEKPNFHHSLNILLKTTPINKAPKTNTTAKPGATALSLQHL